MEKFIKLEVKGRKNFFALYDDQYYFFNSDPPETRGDMKIIEINSNLIAISPEGNTIESKFPFPIMYMIIKAGENVFMSARARRLYCFRDEKTIYISHKNSYEIIVFGLETNVVLFRFNRKYMKVKVTEDSKKFAHGGNYGRVSAGGAWFEVPVAKYHDDVQKLVKHKDLLWIITSTIDKEKGVLVDVFNRDGEYVDNFYLRYPNSIAPFGVSSWLKLLHDGYIYAVEQDNEGSYSVVKYKIQ